MTAPNLASIPADLTVSLSARELERFAHQARVLQEAVTVLQARGTELVEEKRKALADADQAWADSALKDAGRKDALAKLAEAEGENRGLRMRLAKMDDEIVRLRHDPTSLASALFSANARAAAAEAECERLRAMPLAATTTIVVGTACNFRRGGVPCEDFAIGDCGRCERHVYLSGGGDAYDGEAD